MQTALVVVGTMNDFAERLPGKRVSQAADGPGSGHRLLPHTADRIIEAWGLNRSSCLVEALSGLIESFAEVPDAPTTRLVPLAAPAGRPEDALVSLMEEVIYVMEIFAVVPVRFHLAETEGGGAAGDMEVVAASEARFVGAVPKAVSYHKLSMVPFEGGWRCRVLVDV